jgi:hypothetical protein
VTLSIYGLRAIASGVAAASQSAIEIHLYVFQNLADGFSISLRSRSFSPDIPPITDRFRFALIGWVVPLTHPTLWGLFAMSQNEDDPKLCPWCGAVLRITIGSDVCDATGCTYINGLETIYDMSDDNEDPQDD